MLNFMVNAEGGLTTAGYAICIVLGIVVFGIALFLPVIQKKINVRETACVLCMAMALAFITSYIKIFSLPWGGSVTLCSMLFIVLVANWYGVRTGIWLDLHMECSSFTGAIRTSLFQVCCDYVLAFAALGVAGFFAKQKNGLLKGYIVAVLARGAFHALGGYLYWMDYMPDNFPKSLAAVYPIAYNYSFLLAEGLITIVIISIPAVQKALGRVKK